MGYGSSDSSTFSMLQISMQPPRPRDMFSIHVSGSHFSSPKTALRSCAVHRAVHDAYFSLCDSIGSARRPWADDEYHDGVQ